MKSLALAVFGLLLASPASAQVVAIGPFAGHASEGFEGFPAGVAMNCVEDVFMGRGRICTPGLEGATIATSWGFLCTLFPRRGEQFYGSSEGISVYRFNRRVQRFGGFFSSNAPDGTVMLRFFEPDGTLIDEVFANVPVDCTWRWNGWEAPSAIIARVQIINSANEGAFVMMDDMRIDFAELGARYCQGGINSTGGSARVAAVGSTSLASQLDLVSSGQPFLSAGLFYYGNDTTQVPFGEGFRCVRSTGGVGTQRLPISTADVLGTMRTRLDYDAIVNPSTQILPGSTWHFQAIYRDPAGGGTAFNLSDAITLVFEP